MRTIVNNETCMFAVLLGGKGAFARQHEHRIYFHLCRMFQTKEDGHSDGIISCENQDRAADFLNKHGPRVARKYLKAFWRDLGINYDG